MASTKHFYELDSLRGLAAISVMLFHFGLVTDPAIVTAAKHTPLRLMLLGREAVILFFLLSGFVLTLPYRRRPELAYGSFLVKRVCRIYLPYLAALVLAIAGNWFFVHPLAPDAPWANMAWVHRPSPRTILDHFLFLGNYDFGALNTAFWSLVFEFRISLVFPFVALAVLRLRSAWSLAIALTLSALTYPLAMGWAAVFGGNAGDMSFLATFITLHFLAIFIVGSVLAKNMDRVAVLFGRLGGVQVALLALAAVLLYCSDVVGKRLEGHFVYENQVQDWICATGAILLIVLALNSPNFKVFLHSRIVHYCGKISYSLYLVHGTVLFVLFYFFYGRVAFIKLLPVFLIGSFAVADIFHRLIEMPSMRLGRRLTARPPVAVSQNPARQVAG